MPTPLWMDNLRVNRRCFDNLKQTIATLPHRGKPWSGAICAGTGPSLEKNAGFLATRQKDIILIACETALSYLSGRGVVPDIVVTAEEQMPVALAFKDLPGWYPCTALVASTTSCTFGLYLAQKLGADIFFYNSAHPMLIQDGRYQHGKLPGKCPSLTPMCGSILYHAVALASWIGLSKIALVGADFGVLKTRDRNGHPLIQTHAGGYGVDGIPPEAINQAFDYHVSELEFRKQKWLQITNCTEGGRLELYPKSTIESWMAQVGTQAQIAV